ncbi:hypothetical protein JZ751_020494 [Albula glossodonta]|uniref:Uncharacterized protein n=1 Tax=Albula glossodonta TaxID=121402 RepID=A0A8T2PL88_9TELE|nr:hypothetical protein JZ751_020494 [Albula glossodonta]
MVINESAVGLCTPTVLCSRADEPLNPRQALVRRLSVINLENFRRQYARRRWKLSFRIVALCNHLTRMMKKEHRKQEDELVGVFGDGGPEGLRERPGGRDPAEETQNQEEEQHFLNPSPLSTAPPPLPAPTSLHPLPHPMLPRSALPCPALPHSTFSSSARLQPGANASSKSAEHVTERRIPDRWTQTLK